MTAAVVHLAADPERRATNDEPRVHAPGGWPADLESFRSMLTSYARRCLRNLADIDDVVQDTLAAAMASNPFAGRLSATTWLHGILKHKIVDVYRRQARLPVSAPGTQDADETDARFTAEGRWREAPVPWPAPGVALESRQVQSAFEDCLNSLPATAARAFKMREMMGMEIGEIGEVLGVSADHCRALLYQARMRLRDLLEQRLFEGQESALD